MLSDYHGAQAKKGKGRPRGSKEVAEEEDIGAIGRLLQKSLQRSKERHEKATCAVSSSSAEGSTLIVDHVIDYAV